MNDCLQWQHRQRVTRRLSHGGGDSQCGNTKHTEQVSNMPGQSKELRKLLHATATRVQHIASTISEERLFAVAACQRVTRRLSHGGGDSQCDNTKHTEQVSSMPGQSKELCKLLQTRRNKSAAHRINNFRGTIVCSGSMSARHAQAESWRW